MRYLHASETIASEACMPRKKKKNSLQVISIRHTTACNCIPTNTKRWHSAGLMLAHRLRRWTNIKPALCQHLVFAGISISILYSGETGLLMRHSKIKRWYPIMKAILNSVGQICCHFGLSCMKYHYDLVGRCVALFSIGCTVLEISTILNFGGHFVFWQIVHCHFW